jgi:hypothetical protein
VSALAAAAAAPVLPGWPGTAAGLTVIGACVVLGLFAPRLIPRRWHGRAHPWVHRLVTAGMYCGAVALLFTPPGRDLENWILDVLALFGGVASGWGYAAVVILGLFLLLAIILALTMEPHPRAGWYAVTLVVILALAPGGWLHSVLAATEGPGAAAAQAVAQALGGR